LNFLSTPPYGHWYVYFPSSAPCELTVILQVPGSILYGFYVLVFILCIIALIRKRDEVGSQWQIIAVCILFILTTSIIILRIFVINDGLLPILPVEVDVGIAISQNLLAFAL
jgi:hypothetical protein